MAMATVSEVTCFNLDRLLTTDNSGETGHGKFLSKVDV